MKTKSKSGVVVIAEAGVNHNGSIKMAKELIDVAVDAGVDFVKFQTFKASKLASRLAQKAEYQNRSLNELGNSQLDMLSKLELSLQDHLQLVQYCNDQGINFLSTPFDLESIDLLCSIGITIGKIPSGEITNLPYLRKMAKTFNQIILSTGMSTLDEIQAAIDVLKANGLCQENLVILQCNTEYPTPFEDVNLNAIPSMREKFNVEVGYSDHTMGIEVSIAAVALGATIIEKHFTTDRNLPGPDHSSSLEPHELKELVNAIRNVEYALGNKQKSPSPSELKNRIAARKSIVASSEIRAGEKFTENNITVKRPGSGLSPMLWDQIIGQVANRNYLIDDFIEI